MLTRATFLLKKKSYGFITHEKYDKWTVLYD